MNLKKRLIYVGYSPYEADSIVKDLKPLMKDLAKGYGCSVREWKNKIVEAKRFEMGIRNII